MGNLLEVRNLSFSYGENRVLKEIDLSIPENELVSVLGINGAGKSTLLKCLNRIITPQTAEIKLKSKDVQELDLVEISKLISYVPQSVRSSFSMDVFDVVLLGRRPYINWRIGERDREVVSETLRFLNLEDFAFRKFNKLSGGERQRIIIAKAIAQEPQLFLLDEPTSDLDLKNQIQVMKKLKSLVSDSESSKSALVAIHDINIAARFSDRIILLSDGKIVADGTPLEVLTSENIAKVFGVTSEISLPTSVFEPLRVFVKDEIKEPQNTITEDIKNTKGETYEQ
jgi:iron complex transport system ATP-binding protein